MWIVFFAQISKKVRFDLRKQKNILDFGIIC
jgi:hypothetical protein